MEMVNEKINYCLADIERRLQVEAHRLIHLCEKGVVIPDYQDASGRGSMRRFSERNLFEFQVSLELRRFQLPISYISQIIKVLRSFESYVSKTLDSFSLPQSLQEDSSIELNLIILDGTRLYFALKKCEESVFIGELDLNSKSPQKAFSQLRKTSQDPSQQFVSRLELNLNRIAQPPKQ